MKFVRSKEARTKAITMYFDDHERLRDSEGEELFPLQNLDNSWINSLSNEKCSAVQKFIGYNPTSASKLTDDQIEEETLRWLIDTNILATDDDDSTSNDSESDNVQGDSERQWRTSVKYDSIKDLLVASSCDSKLESLTFLWNIIANTLEEQMSSQCQESVKLAVFPRSESLWNYDDIVTILEAIQIAKPLLPSEFDLRLDLFHPDYKHSPKMWSPQWHSPFPTVGLTIKAKKEDLVEEFDIDAMRSKLDVIFQSGDASSQDDQRFVENDPQQILEDCMKWVTVKSNQKEFNEANIDWTVQSQGSPFELYRTVWNSVLNLSAGENRTAIICDPFLDSHTLHRVAITVNAALKKLNIPVRVTQVYHPFARRSSDGKNEYQTRPPCGMIELSPAAPKSR